MKTNLSIICTISALALFTGCARFSSRIIEHTLKDGTVEKTTIVKAYTIFDSQSQLTQLSSGQTEKSQKTQIGSLNQQSSSTNAVALIEAVVGAAVRAAAKP